MSKTKKTDKDLDTKALKKCCRRCNQSFRTKQYRLNHELTCINKSQLQIAWDALTVEQRAEYGTPEKLHESCIKMIEEIKPMITKA